MLRNFQLFTTGLSQNLTNYQSLRFIRKPNSPFGHVRKPFWLGTAKSKLLRLPQRLPYREGELDELHKLTNDFKCLKKSLIHYFKKEYDLVSDTSAIATEKQRLEDEEHVQLMERNRLENERVAMLREERGHQWVENKKEALRAKLLHKEKLEKQKLEEIEERVKIEKMLAKSYITPENVDEAIEKALQTVVDYNFAIDLDGTVYKGRYTKSDTTDDTKIFKLRPISTTSTISPP
ncbi:hypothetical protein CHUAL_002235 [Chamberlinius hualienensis]